MRLTALLFLMIPALLRAQFPTKDSTMFDFVGSGAIQRSLDNGEGIPASTGLGVVLDEYHVDKHLFWGTVDRVFFSGQINVANTDDTLNVKYDAAGRLENPSQFGEAILTPLIGRRAVDLNLVVFFAERIKRKTKDGTVIDKRGLPAYLLSGIQIKYTGSNRLLLDSTGAVKSTMNALRFRVFHDLLSREYTRDFNVMIGGGWGFNSFRGDVAQDANDGFRTSLLGTEQVMFGGFEAFALFRIKNLRAEFAYTWLDPTGNVPGLSKGRMVTTISFVGGFPIKLK